jgi:hypothetical protein
VALGAQGRHAYVVGDHGGAAVVDERSRHTFDIVLRGSLLYVASGQAWACLAGDRGRRELYLVVDGEKRDRLDWAAVTREAERGSDESRIRDWVVARAEAALAEGRGLGPGTEKPRPRPTPPSEVPSAPAAIPTGALFGVGIGNSVMVWAKAASAMTPRPSDPTTNSPSSEWQP